MCFPRSAILTSLVIAVLPAASPSAGVGSADVIADVAVDATADVTLDATVDVTSPVVQEATHAETQLESILEARPGIAAALQSRPAVRSWILDRFAVTDPPLYWDAGPTVSGRSAECDVRDPDRSLVRVAKEASGIDQLTFLIFELHNIQGYPIFEEIHDAAVRGEVNRDQYADRMLRQEFAGLLLFREFCAAHLATLSKSERREARVYYRLVHGTDSYEEHLQNARERGGDLLEHWRRMFDTEVIPEREAR